MQKRMLEMCFPFATCNQRDETPNKEAQIKPRNMRRAINKHQTTYFKLPVLLDLRSMPIY